MTLTWREATEKITAPEQNFEVVEVPIRGVVTKVYKNAIPTLRAVLEASRRHGERIYLVYEDERWSFEDHYRAVSGVASWLTSQGGVNKGDRVAIAMRNFPEWSIAFWAASSIGAVVVPLNAWWSGMELEFGLRDSGSSVLFADEERLERLAPHLGKLDLKQIVVAKAELVPKEGVHRFEQLVELTSGSDSLPRVELDTDDDATIFYTSGTTGEPKGAVGTHRNICTNLMNLLAAGAIGAARRPSARADEPSARADEPNPPPGPNRPANAPATPGTLISVPFFHATGCHSTLVAYALYGGKITMMYRFDPERALELIEREKLTGFGGVPAIVRQILDSPDFATRDTSSVISIGYGGAPAPPELVRRIRRHFPNVMPSNGYGLTETSSVSTINSGTDYLERPDSVGIPMPVVSLRVIDEGGGDVPANVVGELLIKGPNIVRGYWNKPEESARTIVDGWLHTGDLARIDEDGYVYLVDRAKDVVIRGGENVYCAEIEAVIFDHPAVADCAVIGIPHDVLGEEVAAMIVRMPGAMLSEADLKKHVAERLAGFKVPSKVFFRDEPLPRNPAGKVLKRNLRDELSSNTAK